MHAIQATGSLSGAARRMGLTHSTVLRRLDAIEARLEVRLFARPPGKYRLLPEARAILEELATVDETMNKIGRILPEIGGRLEGAIRLTTTDTIAQFALPNVLQAISRIHPRLSFEIIATNLPIDMTTPEAEITIRPALTLPEGLIGEKIGEIGLSVYGARDYLRSRRDLPPERLDWLGVAHPLNRSPVGRREAELGVAPSHRFDSFVGLANCAALGMGVGFLPDFVARAMPGLIRAPQCPDALITNVFLASHPDVARTQRISKLHSLLRAELVDVFGAGP